MDSTAQDTLYRNPEESSTVLTLECNNLKSDATSLVHENSVKMESLVTSNGQSITRVSSADANTSVVTGNVTAAPSGSIWQLDASNTPSKCFTIGFNLHLFNLVFLNHKKPLDANTNVLSIIWCGESQTILKNFQSFKSLRTKYTPIPLSEFKNIFECITFY